MIARIAQRRFSEMENSLEKYNLQMCASTANPTDQRRAMPSNKVLLPHLPRVKPLPLQPRALRTSFCAPAFMPSLTSDGRGAPRGAECLQGSSVEEKA